MRNMLKENSEEKQQTKILYQMLKLSKQREDKKKI